MTKEEFKNTQFNINTLIDYKGRSYPVYSVDFQEELIGLNIEDECVKWVRYENCKVK
jgi:hypothetical protein